MAACIAEVTITVAQGTGRDLGELIFERLGHLMAKIDDLTAQVAQNTTVIGSALTLIQGFSAQLDAAIAAAKAGNDTALTQLATDLKTQDVALAAAVAANTPTPPTT